MTTMAAIHVNDEFTMSKCDIESLLEWACLVAAQVRRNPLCVEHHRRALQARGETVPRLDEITRWRRSAQFSDKEKSVLGLSEAISLYLTAKEIESPLREARAHFNPGELVRLSARVAALNDWIELRENAPIRVLVVEDR